MGMIKTIGLAAALALGGISAHATTITTSFDSNNGFAGIMFDVEVGANALRIESFDLNIGNSSLGGTNIDVDLWVRDGTHVGFSNSSVGWSLQESTAGITSNGEDNATPWDVSDFILDANSTYSFYIDTDPAEMNYINAPSSSSRGETQTANADLSILWGTGKGNPAFTGQNFISRGFSGSINYELAEIAPVPLPASLPLLFTALLGLGVVRRGRKTA